MCIIAIKPANVPFPTDDELETMYYNNPDGAGMMYIYKHKVVIDKGYMKLTDFLARVKRVKEVVDTTATPFVFHFRITTHGGTNPENCHPFPIVGNPDALKKKYVFTDVGVAHNGIIHISPRDGISDTMEYILSQLSVIKSINRKFYREEKFLNLIKNAITSKMAFLAEDGTISTVGEFITEKDGMMYSNSSYLARTWTPSSYYGYGWDACDWYSTAKRKQKAVASKPLACLSDLVKSATVATDDGRMIYTDVYAVDKKDRLYYIDMDSGCAVRVEKVHLADKVKYNPNVALHYDVYDSMDDFIGEVYSGVVTDYNKDDAYWYEDEDLNTPPWEK